MKIAVLDKLLRDFCLNLIISLDISIYTLKFNIYSQTITRTICPYLNGLPQWASPPQNPLNNLTRISPQNPLSNHASRQNHLSDPASPCLHITLYLTRLPHRTIYLTPPAPQNPLSSPLPHRTIYLTPPAPRNHLSDTASPTEALKFDTEQSYAGEQSSQERQYPLYNQQWLCRHDFL